VQEAKQWGADLLVVGKHHKGAIERVFLGSTTEAVLKSWPCHTLVLAAP
jgi:nucleotide-binding universal stress UspA family protein